MNTEVTLNNLLELISNIIGSTGYEPDEQEQALIDNAVALADKGFEIK